MHGHHNPYYIQFTAFMFPSNPLICSPLCLLRFFIFYCNDFSCSQSLTYYVLPHSILPMASTTPVTSPQTATSARFFFLLNQHTRLTTHRLHNHQPRHLRMGPRQTHGAQPPARRSAHREAARQRLLTALRRREVAQGGQWHGSDEWDVVERVWGFEEGGCLGVCVQCV